MTIKITDELIEYLELNHAGQHCLKYWVLSRIVVVLRLNKWTPEGHYTDTINISEEEANAIPDRFLKAVCDEK